MRSHRDGSYSKRRGKNDPGVSWVGVTLVSGDHADKVCYSASLYLLQLFNDDLGRFRKPHQQVNFESRLVPSSAWFQLTRISVWELYLVCITSKSRGFYPMGLSVRKNRYNMFLYVTWPLAWVTVLLVSLVSQNISLRPNLNDFSIKLLKLAPLCTVRRLSKC